MQCVFTVSDIAGHMRIKATKYTSDKSFTLGYTEAVVNVNILQSCNAPTLKRCQIRSLDSPTGLFVNHIRSSFDCDFVSLDSRIHSRKYTIENFFTLGSTKEADLKKPPYYKVVRAFDYDKVTILQSCNDYANVNSNVYGCAELRLAFDPKKSPYYKVELAGEKVGNLAGKTGTGTVWEVMVLGFGSPSGDFGKFTLLVPGLCLLSFKGLGFDLLAR
nr:hypothetical protein [Tanacetum cinerariifolium]